MARKRHSAEQIIQKLREAEIALSQGRAMDICCSVNLLFFIPASYSLRESSRPKWIGYLEAGHDYLFVVVLRPLWKGWSGLPNDRHTGVQGQLEGSKSGERSVTGSDYLCARQTTFRLETTAIRLSS